MRGITGWNYRPYRPADRQAETTLPFICSLSPSEKSITLEWFDKGSDGPHTLRWREKDTQSAWQEQPLTESRPTIDNLLPQTDYALQIIRAANPAQSSAVRLARTGTAVGTTVNYLHPEDPLYAFSGHSLCSPSLVRLPSGALLTSMDVFEANQPQNLVLIFRSDDDGKTWRYVTDMFPAFWATLFMHGGRLYMQCCSTEYGDILIGASDDEGKTWTKPVQLFVGSASNKAAGWQRTPMPILRAHGRLWVATDYGAWSQGGHAIGLLSCAEEDDLLVSENWHISQLVPYSPDWPGAPEGKTGGILEGSVVVPPGGGLETIARLGLVNCEPNHGVAVALGHDPSDPDGATWFDRFVQMPSGSNSKSHVVQDPVSGEYIAIGNLCVDPATPSQRNVLALQASPDLVNWRVLEILLDYRHEDWQKVGFQYIYFIIDGEDILYLSRTAMNGAFNFHDANYQTFHRVAGFRALLARQEGGTP